MKTVVADLVGADDAGGLPVQSAIDKDATPPLDDAVHPLEAVKLRPIDMDAQPLGDGEGIAGTEAAHQLGTDPRAGCR